MNGLSLAEREINPAIAELLAHASTLAEVTA